ncbi:multicopper oxidase domain-containing protein [Paracidobacterium acidisoli]|uniref:Copper oxidase n=1 Tax=Paracidobacterium acidisoli TaxID=2303751 RepID=A0A372ITF5_9BACT|nr:multicopper oxidase domain-containing protein [Paracidobacterium acidisoli]MBT9329468.1 multicopper oxidase domain-containing protein [Paracidobacterium acidisoli]
MQLLPASRRSFLKSLAMTGAAGLLPSSARSLLLQENLSGPVTTGQHESLRIAVTPLEIAPNRIVSVATYNGGFPGPLLRFKEGRPVTVDVVNDTEAPELLHWHGQAVPVEVDGAAEEGSPFIAPHSSRRIVFTPRPAGFRFYHTHVRAGADLSAGQYSGLVGPVYIEPAHDQGSYDREVFLTLKEFEPSFSRGGDMDMDFLSPATVVPELKQRGEAAMNASLAKGMPHGFEVGYASFTINGRMLGHGEPVRVKRGERVLFHILNGSATEIRSLALPGHLFRVVALDGNPVPVPASVPVLWLGTAERISAIVEMNHPGVWIMGDLADDDRHHGMGIVVEYAGQSGRPQWIAPPKARWSYARFANPEAAAAAPDETIEMTFVKENAADAGFNRWTINGVAYPDAQMMAAPSHRLKQGSRYRIRMHNQSDDIHPVHLHRHSFELTRYGGQSMSGLMKDVVMLGGYQEAEIDFVADNPGMTLFHCHQQLHMDFGFMTLFDYA